MIARKITRRLSQLRRDVVDRTGWTARQIRRELGSAIEPGGSATHVLIAPPGAGNIGDQAMVDEAVKAALPIAEQLDVYSVRPFRVGQDGPALIEPADA